MPMGCAGIQLRNNWVGDYPAMWLSTSNKGWHSYWFYLKNDAGVYLAHNQRGPRFLEEVGCPKEGQEEDPGPSRRHPLPEGEGAEGVRNHRCLPCEEGGTTNEPRASPVHDGTRGIIQQDGTCQGGALSL